MFFSKNKLKITLNGKSSSEKEMKKIIPVLSNPAILTEKGGYLFKAIIHSDHIFLGLVPYMINNQRMNHYDLVIPDDPYRLTGFINSNCSLTIIMEVSAEYNKIGLTELQKYHFARSYIEFCEFLIHFGFNPDFELNIVTEQ
ncbi:MAG: hypothetical protein MJB14_15115, partial [Spirochaetes bacterium]|nr:hypothetical protein [Spirochaetota bacterium]